MAHRAPQSAKSSLSAWPLISISSCKYVLGKPEDSAHDDKSNYRKIRALKRMFIAADRGSEALRRYGKQKSILY